MPTRRVCKSYRVGDKGQQHPMRAVIATNDRKNLFCLSDLTSPSNSESVSQSVTHSFSFVGGTMAMVETGRGPKIFPGAAVTPVERANARVSE